MQLPLCAVLALLAVGPAVCWPIDDYMDQVYRGDYPSMEQFEGHISQSEVEDGYLSAMKQRYINEQANSQSSYNSYYADFQGEHVCE